MKLYYYRGACSLVVRIILNELGIKFDSETVDLRAKKTMSGADYLAINPKGAVPALALDNGEVLTEVQVILQYLADHVSKQSLLAPVGDFSRYQTLEWMNYISTELHKSIGMMFNPAVSEDFKQSLLIPLIHVRLENINRRLADKAFIMGDHFTLPDAYLFVMMRWAHFFKLELSKYPHLNAYIGRLNARASVVSSLEQESDESHKG